MGRAAHNPGPGRALRIYFSVSDFDSRDEQLEQIWDFDRFQNLVTAAVVDDS